MIVSEPPSSTLRAAPKKRFGRCSALASTPPVSTLPDERHHGVVGARQTRDRVEQDDDVLLVLDQALGALDHHFGDLHVARGRLVERRGNDFGAHAALHFGDFFRTLVDQQHDQVRFRMVVRDRLRDVLQHHRLAGFRRRDDQSALAFADRRDQIEDATGDVFGRAVAALRAGSALRGNSGVRFSNRILFFDVLRRFAVDVSTLSSAK